MPYPNPNPSPAPAEDKVGGYTLEVSFTDLTLQPGGAADTPVQVKYGPAAVSPGGIVSIAANGVLTILKPGPLMIKSRLRAGRSGASGVSNLFFWVEISTNGGTSWSVLGNSVDIHLDSSNDTDVFFDFSALQLPVGVKLRSMFARSSTGNISGDLRFSTPGVGLLTYGVPIAPSAQISVYKNIDYQY